MQSHVGDTLRKPVGGVSRIWVADDKRGDNARPCAVTSRKDHRGGMSGVDAEVAEVAEVLFLSSKSGWQYVGVGAKAALLSGNQNFRNFCNESVIFRNFVKSIASSTGVR